MQEKRQLAQTESAQHGSVFVFESRRDCLREVLPCVPSTTSTHTALLQEGLGRDSLQFSLEQEAF